MNLWYIGISTSSSVYDMKTARLEMFARVSHSITGCIEAPIQMVVTLFLMMKEVLPLPWDKAWHRSLITDSKGNELDLYIPAVTLVFSIMDMMKCAVMINIFNVYIGQLESSSGFKYYANLAAGHLPFFLHSICLRVFAFAFFMIYLNERIFWVPIILIWLSNLLIGKRLGLDFHNINENIFAGYITPKPRLPKKTRSAIKRIESMERGKTSLPKFEKKNDSPIWLNSFLSIFVPSCSLDLIDPALVNFYSYGEIEFQDKRGNPEKVNGEEVKKHVTEFNKTFQRKIIQRQLISSTVVIFVTTGVVWYLVTYNQFWGYSKNLLSNFEFNIFCAVLAIMSLFSTLFVINMDIFEIFGLNSSTGKRCITLQKAFAFLLVIGLILR